MAVNTSSVRDLLLPGLREITGRYQQLPVMWDKLFKKGNSKMALERTAEMAYLPLAKLKNEGGNTAFDNNAGERYVYNQEHQEIGLGYAITRKAIDDNLYKGQFQASNLGLQNSFQQTKEVYGAAIFNSAQVYNPAMGGDGQPLCSLAHPLDQGTYANTPTVQVDLNEATLLSAQVSIRTNFRDARGLRIFARARKLVIPPALEPVAIRLIDTELRPGTADNDVNAINRVSGGLPERYVVNDFLTNPFAWFILTNIDGLLYLERVPFESDMWVDDLTDNLLVKGYERYSFGAYNSRAIYGSFPTS